jgi:hypothetical protein
MMHAITKTPQQPPIVFGMFGIVATVLLFIYVDLTPNQMWYSLLALTILLQGALGKALCGTWKGVLVDERNVVSLSRVQMLLWTTLILTALLAAVLGNIRSGLPFQASNAVLPVIPADLWVLMGISTGSLLASPLLLQPQKTSQTPAGNTVLELLVKQGYQANQISLSGTLFQNLNASQARWSDLITGEQTGNCAYLDVARLQMCFLTLIAVVIYAVLLNTMLTQTALIATLPPLNDGLLFVIAISHGGYLLSKANQNSALTSTVSTGNTATANMAAVTDHTQAVG